MSFHNNNHPHSSTASSTNTNKNSVTCYDRRKCKKNILHHHPTIAVSATTIIIFATTRGFMSVCYFSLTPFYLSVAFFLSLSLSHISASSVSQLRRWCEHLKTLNPKFARGGKRHPVISLPQPLIFPLHLASFPSLLTAINHSNQPRSSPGAEREGAESMKRRREGGRLRILMVKCGCLTFKTRTDWTSWVLMALALILIQASFA